MKIYLVEDEVYALRALRQKIEDLGEEYYIVGEAHGGTKALEEIPLLFPDVVLTDIRMPDMDGLELIERLAALGCQAIPAIISGYQEFEYAKQAIRLNVQDYLLKPVRPEELAGCLTSCKQKLESMRGRENVISYLVGQDIPAVNLRHGPGGCSFVTYVVLGNALSDPDNIVHPNAPYVSVKEMEALFQAMLPADATCHCAEALFTNEKAVTIHAQVAAPVKEAFGGIAAALQSETGCYVTLQYAEAGEEDSFAPLLRRCRHDAVRNCRLGETVVCDEKATGFLLDTEQKDRIALFAQLLRNNETRLLQNNLVRMFDGWHEKGYTLYATQRNLSFILNSLKVMLPLRKEFDLDSVFCVENIVCFSQSPEELCTGFFQLLQEIFNTPEDMRALEGTELVRRIERFCEQNITENVTLQMLADKMDISKVYLCRMFKKYKNMTPIDYFTNLKIERAKELLRTYPELPIREISDSLGFNDMYYFSKVFKRVTGTPPSEARQAMLAEVAL